MYVARNKSIFSITIYVLLLGRIILKSELGLNSQCRKQGIKVCNNYSNLTDSLFPCIQRLMPTHILLFSVFSCSV